MNIISSVNTYLVISFLLTIWVIAKYAYKKIDEKLSNDVKNIKDLLSGLEKTKIDSEKQIVYLKQELAEANEHIIKAMNEAEQTAKAITEKSNQEISRIIEAKQEEYDHAVQKMRKSLSVEMQNKLVDAVIRELLNKLNEAKEDRDFQNSSIEKSLRMLEELAEK